MPTTIESGDEIPEKFSVSGLLVFGVACIIIGWVLGAMSVETLAYYLLEK